MEAEAPNLLMMVNRQVQKHLAVKKENGEAEPQK